MVLGKLLARVVPGAGKDGKHGPGGKGAAAAFVRDLVQLQEALFPPKDESVPYAPGLVRRIWLAEHKGEAPAPEDVRLFENLRTQLLGRYPDADALALRWLCDVPGLQAWCDQHLPPPSFAPGRYFEVVAVLNLWVQRHPAPGAADAVAGTLEEHVRALPPSFHGAPPRGMHHRPVVDAMVGTLARLEAAEGVGAPSAPPFARCRRLLDMLLATAPPPPGPGPHLAGHTPAQQLLQDVAVAFAPWLAGAGHLQGEYLDRLLLRIPNLPNRAQARDAGWALSPPVPPTCAAAVAAAVDRMLGRVLAGDPDPQVRAVLWCYQGYAGLDHFLAACRALEQHLGRQPIEKQRVRQWWSDSGHPLAWVNRLLVTIPPPSHEDTQRAAELAKLAPQTLLVAALYAPAWADLVEPHLDWPALGALARWLKRGAGSEPWRPYQQPAPEDEEGAGPGAVDRAAALEAG